MTPTMFWIDQLSDLLIIIGLIVVSVQLMRANRLLRRLMNDR